VVAQHADIWNSVPETVEEYQRKGAVLAGHCAAIGRDPGAIEHSVQVFADLAQPGETRDLITGLVAAGARHVVISISPPFPPGTVRQVAEEIVEPVRTHVAGG
jgi:alkanesulfonate monooxygenase SsuD/methylene tetrahydromethanopterin reductase-like flavin-dependent oxidoreductase (luciferase family)